MFANNYYYYITIALQAICVIHCIRKHNENKWIWIIIFLPVIGCIAYIFDEMFRNNNLKNVQSGIGSVIYPAGKIKKLEKQLQFADTFSNRILLADAYLASGKTNKAIELYENSLTGAFTENEHVLTQLIIAYFEVQRYADIIPIAKKLYKTPQFQRSRAHMLYAMALEKTGNTAAAENEFKLMKGRYAYFESRYQYGLFLQRNGRNEEAKQVFSEMAGEASYLGAREKKYSRTWIVKAKDELKKV